MGVWDRIRGFWTILCDPVGGLGILRLVADDQSGKSRGDWQVALH
jgi:hypothetical protein